MGASFYDSCRYDVCANQRNLTAAKEAACGSLLSFSAHCKSIKYSVLWRTAANCRKLDHGSLLMSFGYIFSMRCGTTHDRSELVSKIKPDNFLNGMVNTTTYA